MKIVSILRQTAFAVVIISSAGFCSNGDEADVKTLGSPTSVHLAYDFFMNEGCFHLEPLVDHSLLSGEASALAKIIREDPLDEVFYPLKELTELRQKRVFDVNAELSMILRGKAQKWVELAKQAELGKLPIAGCDSRAAAFLASRAVILLNGPDHNSSSEMHKEFETSAILAAHNCMQASKSASKDHEKLNWCWRGLELLSLELYNAVWHSSAGPDSYKKAIELLESVRKPIQNFRALCELPHWGRLSLRYASFPLEVTELSFMPAIIEENIARSWLKIVQLKQYEKRIREVHIPHSDLSDIEQDIEIARKNTLRAAKTWIHAYKKRILDLEHELSLDEDELVSALDYDELVTNSICVKYTMEAEDVTKLKQSALPLLLAELYKGVKTAEIWTAKFLANIDQKWILANCSNAKPHLEQSLLYAQKETEVYLKLAKHTDLVFFTIKAAYTYFQQGCYEKTVQLAQPVIDTYGLEACEKTGFWFADPHVYGYSVVGFSDILGHAKTVLAQQQLQTTK